jgi:hypothetical protein
MAMHRLVMSRTIDLKAQHQIADAIEVGRQGRLRR